MFNIVDLTRRFYESFWKKYRANSGFSARRLRFFLNILIMKWLLFGHLVLIDVCFWPWGGLFLMWEHAVLNFVTQKTDVMSKAKCLNPKNPEPNCLWPQLDPWAACQTSSSLTSLTSLISNLKTAVQLLRCIAPQQAVCLYAHVRGSYASSDLTSLAEWFEIGRQSNV